MGSNALEERKIIITILAREAAAATQIIGILVREAVANEENDAY